jgi:hypothetical protein
MDIDSRRKDKKTCAIDDLVTGGSCSGMNDPAIPDRDIRFSPSGGLDIFKDKLGATFHADMIGTGSYRRAVFLGKIRNPICKYNVFLAGFQNSMLVCRRTRACRTAAFLIGIRCDGGYYG